MHAKYNHDLYMEENMQIMGWSSKRVKNKHRPSQRRTREREREKEGWGANVSRETSSMTRTKHQKCRLSLQVHLFWVRKATRLWWQPPAHAVGWSWSWSSGDDDVSARRGGVRGVRTPGWRKERESKNTQPFTAVVEVKWRKGRKQK